ncbi:MAG: radical SAM protein [Desulfomonilaceae bacterium]
MTMLIQNPNSNRENPFRSVYDNPEFVSILQNTHRLPSFPFLVDIELTNHCNLSCIMCPRHAMKRDKGFMSGEIFKRVVEECAQHSTPIRLIRFGEPFLHPKIVEFCRYAKSNDLMVHITNNGLVIKETDMQALVDLAVDSIIFSFQGTTRERYQTIRNNCMYDKLVHTIKRLVEIRGDREKPFIHVSTTVLDDSKMEIGQFVDNWATVVDSVGVGRTLLYTIPTDDLEPSLAKKIRELRRSETIKRVYGPCREVFQKLSVDWDGTITCCCGDFDRLLAVGHIRKSSLSHVWNNSRRLAIYRELLEAREHKSLKLCSTCYPTYEEI